MVDVMISSIYLLFFSPSNPDVVLVKKAVLGEDPLPPQPVSSQGILSEGTHVLFTG